MFVTLVVFLSFIEATGDTRATIQKGQPVNIICAFNDDPSREYDSFYICCRSAGRNEDCDAILSCNWKGKPPEPVCTEYPGFTFDEKVSEIVTLHTTEQKVQDIDKCYSGIVGSLGNGNLCNITLEATGDTRATIQKGQPVNIICAFNGDPSREHDSFYICCRSAGSNEDCDAILSCNWKGKPPEPVCTEYPGFTFDEKVSEIVTLHTTEQKVQDIDECYSGIVGSLGNGNLCNITLEEDESITPITVTETALPTTGKEEKEDESITPITVTETALPTTGKEEKEDESITPITVTETSLPTTGKEEEEGNDDSGLVVAIIIIIIIIILIVGCGIAYMKCDWLKEKWQQLRSGQPSEEDDEMTATGPIYKGKTPPTGESQLMLEEPSQQANGHIVKAVDFRCLNNQGEGEGQQLISWRCLEEEEEVAATDPISNGKPPSIKESHPILENQSLPASDDMEMDFTITSIEEEEKESGEQTKGIQKQGKPEEKLTDPREDKEKAEYTDSERSGEQGQVFARGGNGHRAHSLPARSSNSTASGDINVHSMQAGDGGRCRIHSEPESDNCAVPDDDFNVHDKQAGGGSAGDA